jgi:hypothetical protein
MGGLVAVPARATRFGVVCDTGASTLAKGVVDLTAQRTTFIGRTAALAAHALAVAGQ